MFRCYFRIPLILLVLFISGSKLTAQLTEITFRNVGRLEEYSSVQANCIFQDSLGLIWIGTRKGLDRWDGINITNYPGLNSGSKELAEIISITEDKDNNLWMIARSGSRRDLYKFCMETQRFSPYTLCYENRPLLPDHIKYDPLGFIWIACQRKGIFQYNLKLDTLFHIPTANSPASHTPNSHVVSIVSDSTGIRWIADKDHGLFSYDHEKKELNWIDFKLTPEKMFYSLDMDADPEGHLWIFGTDSDLYKINPYTLNLNVIAEKNPDQINIQATGSLKVDHLARVWYGNSLGLKLYDPGNDSITIYGAENQSPCSIQDILVDKHNNILIATNEGAKFINNKEALIAHITHFKNTIVRKGGWINDMVRTGDEFWIGTSTTGLLRYISKSKNTRQYFINDQQGRAPDHMILRVLKDRNERIWVMDGNGLHRYNPETDDFDPFGFSFSQYIYQDREDMFWICGVDHIWRFDPISHNSTLINLKETIPDMNSEDGYSPFIRDDEGIFWLGASGLVRIDPLRGNWQRFPSDRLGENKLGDNNIRDILCDSKSRVWVTTPAGVYRVSTYPETDSVGFHLVKPADGSTLCATSIAEDKAGNICIGSCTGMYALWENGQMEYYSYLDGLPENPRRIRWLGSDPDGSIYAGTVDLSHISSGFLTPNNKTPEVVLTSISVSGEQLSPGPDSPINKTITLAKKVELKHKQNFLRIDFASLNFDNPSKNRYKYFMEGVDNDTVWAGGKHFAEYTDLSPGKYRFWVTGSNNSGVWNQTGRSILIHIHPPWYRTRTALIIWDILVILLIIGFIRLRTRKLNRDKVHLEIEVENRVNEIRWMNEQIKEMEEMKTRFFNNISHEFRTLISLITNPMEDIWKDRKISRNSRSKLELMRRNSNKLKSLVNQLLDISRIDKGSMSLVLTKTSIFDFVHAIAVSFLSLAESKGIRYSFNIPADESCDCFDTDKLEKIINNLLSNAFKFTEEGGQVILKLEKKSNPKEFEGLIEIMVSDTGTGIPKNEHEKIFDRFYQAESSLIKEGGGAGIGLALTHDLIKLMHGNITLESDLGKGSTFKVEIPLGKVHLREQEYSLAPTRNQYEYLSKEAKDIQESMTDGKKETAIRDGSTGERPKVLVVEDNAEVRSMIAEHLQDRFRVIEAVNGSAGLKIALEQMPDLVLTDLIMPHMDGMEMCSRLKSDLRTSHIPVIMLTGKASLEDKIIGLESGADDYIPKPFEMEEVVIRVKNLVNQRKKLREKFSTMLTFNPHEMEVSSMDQRFLKQVAEVVDHELCNDKFDVTGLCKVLNISHSTLSRKLNALTGLSPVEYIRTRRLQRAAFLLKQQYGNVSQVAMEVGFNNPSYFTKMFKKAYSISPSEFTKS